ncbi:MAG: nucleoside/nucleotide kinase family protein [Pseudonocardia sp.]|nr:nucleoside/nucleotide kinase family protein [Pseudonocardia sp.]
MTLASLVQRARRLTEGRHRAVLGIAGSPGSGKSTLAAALLAALGATALGAATAHVPMDGFHLADVELARLGRLARKGAPDTFDVGGYVALLRRIRADAEEMIYAPAFERTLEQPLAGAVGVPRSARLVLTEGNYLLLDEPGWREVRAELDEVWFCDPHPAVRRERLVARHTAFGKSPADAAAWVAAVDDPNAARVEQTRDHADLVIPGAVLEQLGPP